VRIEGEECDEGFSHASSRTQAAVQIHGLCGPSPSPSPLL